MGSMEKEKGDILNYSTGAEGEHIAMTRKPECPLFLFFLFFHAHKT